MMSHSAMVVWCMRVCLYVSRRKLRRMVIDLVLATDSTQHFEVLSKWNDKAKKGTLDLKQSADDRLLLMKLALKCADCAYFAKPSSIFRGWLDRLQKEYFN